MNSATTPTSTPTPMPLVKLTNFLGATRGFECYREVLEALALDELRTPDDNARFGEELIARGGALATIGRAIKIQAILHGATRAR